MFVPTTEKEYMEMLDAIGAASFEELIKQIPAKLRYPKYDLPAGLTEMELAEHLKNLGSKNKKVLSFLGGGAYEHFIPAGVRAIASRGEFMSAYTPYQAEASQGTLQAIYEFQSLICALFEMDFSNASHYDGAAALAEAVAASLRITSRKRVVLPGALHPHYRKTLVTYFGTHSGVSFVDVPCPEGTMDLEELKNLLAADCACVVVESPNFFGCLEDTDSISKAAKSQGALVVAVPDPLSLGMLRPPGSFGADFAVAEGQGLGNTLSYGGPYLGLFTCRKQYVRSMPGRIAGMTKDAQGKRAFVLTLQAREQHIRRERAFSNVCSNEALCALSACVYLTMLGPQGVREAAQMNARMGHLAARRLSSVPGFSLRFKSPFYNEFVLKCPGDASDLRDLILKENIIAGLAMAEFFPDMKDCLLVCATETKTAADIDRLELALRKHGAKAKAPALRLRRRTAASQ